MSMVNLSKYFEAKARKQCARILRKQKAGNINSAILLESIAQYFESSEDLSNYDRTVTP